MPYEYLILLISTAFYLLAWLPASVAKKQSYGMKWLASNRSRPPGELVPWGQRAEKAHQNLKDYFPGFVVVVIILGIHDGFTIYTSLLCALFLFARLAHMATYIAGLPLARATSFMISMLALFTLLILAVIATSSAHAL